MFIKCLVGEIVGFQDFSSREGEITAVGGHAPSKNAVLRNV